MGALICRFTSSFLFCHRPAAQRCSPCGVRLVQEGVLDEAVLRITALDLGFLPVAPNLLSTHDPHAFREMARPPSPLFTSRPSERALCDRRSAPDLRRIPSSNQVISGDSAVSFHTAKCLIQVRCSACSAGSPRAHRPPPSRAV